MNNINEDTIITIDGKKAVDTILSHQYRRLHLYKNLNEERRTEQQNPQTTHGIFRRNIVQLLCALDRALSFSLRRFLLKHLRRLIQKIDGRYISSKPIDGRGVRDFQAKYY